ncbi:MAG TPA: chorismate mutase [Gaiellaceae bacterium]|nr:chorismate mutase [Gaiellaceae bacterium]
MSAPQDDPVLATLRGKVAEVDRSILELVNTRLGLVQEIRRHKLAYGLPFLDPERERWLVSYLETVNRGPLTSEGVGELVRTLLDLIKREIARAEDGAHAGG